MKTGTLAVVALLLFAGAAQAQQAPTQPCTRGAQSMRMGGVDADEARCEMALIEQQRDAALTAAARNQATLILQQSDVVAAQNLAAATKAWLDVAWPAYAKSIGSKGD